MRHHVLITGTGRAGTTFLVELLTRCGLDTGFTPDTLDAHIHAESNAGLEHDVRNPNAPYIVKSPWICDYIDEVLSFDDTVIDHIFVPMRRIEDVAESRRRVARTGSPYGGLVHTNSLAPGDQELVHLKQIYNLLLHLSSTRIPITFLRFPRLVYDAGYTARKLAPLLNSVPWNAFVKSFDASAHPTLIHHDF